MDPITHALVGATAAKSIKASNKRLWIMAILGMFPDWDVIASSWGPWAYFLQHRGISHSLFGLVIQTFFFAVVLAPWDKGPFRTRLFHYSLPLALHIFCDLLTSYGVPLLSPFSMREFSLDLVSPVTLIPMVFMAIGLVWLHRKDYHGWRSTSPLWILWVLYLGLTFTGKAYAALLTTGPYGYSQTMPTTINPFSWRAIESDGKDGLYRQYSIDVLKGKSTAVNGFSMPNGDFPVQASLKNLQVEEFVKTTRWPMVRVTPSSSGWTVEWGSLLFSARGTVRSKIIVEEDHLGQIVSLKQAFGFWDPKN